MQLTGPEHPGLTSGSNILAGKTNIKNFRDGKPVRSRAVFISILLIMTGFVSAGSAETGKTAVWASESGVPVEYLIHISVDGMRPDAVTTLGPLNLPNFFRMRVEGAITDNARADYDITVTLPNHICMVTGRGVLGPDGHGVDFNFDDGSTVAETHGSYVACVFDVVSDYGLKTAMYATKEKFALIDRSWNELNGAADTVGTDDGFDKIDRYIYQVDIVSLTDSLLSAMASGIYSYNFLHYGDPDVAGHLDGWNSIEYFNAVKDIDIQIGRIFDLIGSDPIFQGRTAVILTSDHGGFGFDHSDPAIPENYTVPMYVWGPDVPAGADLYLMNIPSRQAPGETRPDYQSEPQPIRNAGTGNLALDLLGLPAIPGSSVNAEQDLFVYPDGDDLPVIAITSPENGATYSFLDTARFEVDVSVISGAIEKVEFFSNWIKLGEDATWPYTFDWNGLPIGDYVITARAVKDTGIGAAANISIEVFSIQTDAKDDPIPKAPLTVYPNPFSGSTRIDYSTDRSERVTFSVYDLAGRRVGFQPLGLRERGSHSVYFNASGLQPGVYFYRMQTGVSIETGKLMIIR